MRYPSATKISPEVETATSVGLQSREWSSLSSAGSKSRPRTSEGSLVTSSNLNTCRYQHGELDDYKQDAPMHSNRQGQIVPIALCKFGVINIGTYLMHSDIDKPVVPRRVYRHTVRQVKPKQIARQSLY